jgi:trk system potassium uptake protein TrkH
VEAAGPWGPFPAALFFFLMALGGCAGSTVSGAKVFRLQILTAVARAQARRLLHPHGVFHPHYGHRVVPPDVPAAVMGFLFLYAGTFLALALGLSFLGLDFVTAASGALASVSGSGVGLGPVIGLGGSFAPLPEAAKGLLTVGMILGRLEVLPVLVLFAPPFWRR